MYKSITHKISILIILAAVCIFALPVQITQGQEETNEEGIDKKDLNIYNPFNEEELNWDGWKLKYETGRHDDGLAIFDVSYNGKKILGRASFPVMPTYYASGDCGPHFNKLDKIFWRAHWAEETRGQVGAIVSREFTFEGEQWYELGMRKKTNYGYDIYQVWYFNGDGIINAHVFTRKHGGHARCEIAHTHYPNWRLNFDLAGPKNDQILNRGARRDIVFNNEFNADAVDAINHNWVVRDTVTEDEVHIDFDARAWNVGGGPVVPESTYDSNRLGGRVSKPNEELWNHREFQHEWEISDSQSLWIGNFPFFNDESLKGNDVELWYAGKINRKANEDSKLWQSTGLRLTVVESSDERVNIARGKTVTASSTRPENSENQSFHPSEVVDGVNKPSSRWVSQAGNGKEWITVDLGSVVQIDEITIKWRNAYAKQYQVSVSENGHRYHPFTFPPVTSDGGIDTFYTYHPSVTWKGRYIRIKTIEHAPGKDVYSIGEIEVYSYD